MWRVTIVDHDGSVSVCSQGDASWRRLFDGSRLAVEVEPGVDDAGLLFVSVTVAGVRATLKRDNSATSSLPLRVGRFYQILPKNGLVLNATSYVFSSSAPVPTTSVDQTLQYDARVDKDGDVDMSTQPYDAAPSHTAASDQTLLYDADVPSRSSRVAGLDQTQLYDVAHSRVAGGDQTQLYDAVTRVTSGADQTQLIDSSRPIGRRGHERPGAASDATQPFDAGAAGDENATQAYSAAENGQGAAEMTQLYDGGAPMRPPPSRGRATAAADQTQLIDQRKTNMDEMETMIYDEDPSPPASPPQHRLLPPPPPPRVVPRSAPAPPAVTNKNDLETQPYFEEDKDDEYDAIATNFMAKKSIEANIGAEKKAVTEGDADSGASTDDMAVAGDDERDSDARVREAHAPKTSAAPPSTTTLRKRARSTLAEEDQEEEAKPQKRARTEEKEKKEAEPQAARRSGRALKPSALIMESQMGAEIDELPSNLREAKRRAKEESPRKEEALARTTQEEGHRELSASKSKTPARTKRSASNEPALSAEASADTSDASATPKAHRVRLPSPPPLETRARPHVPPFPADIAVIFSGVEGEEATELAKIVTELGGRVVKEVREASHLVTVPEFKRTLKLLSAIAFARPIVLAKWLLDSRKAGRFLDAAKYPLKDRKAEKEFEFTLVDSQRLWRESDRGVFEGLTFFVTKRAKPGPVDLKTFITQGGGKFVTTATATRTLRPNECFIISCEEDADEYALLLAAGLRVRTPELVMSAVLQHKLDPDDEKSLLQGAETARGTRK